MTFLKTRAEFETKLIVMTEFCLSLVQSIECMEMKLQSMEK